MKRFFSFFLILCLIFLLAAPAHAAAVSAPKVDFTVTPIVSPENSVVEGMIRFTGLPSGTVEKYRLEWYFGDIRVRTFDNFTLTNRAKDSISCSVPFSQIRGSQIPVTVKLTPKKEGLPAYSFTTYIENGGKSDAYYYVQQKKALPYAIDVYRNQGVVIVYGLDDQGQYSDIVQVFNASVGREGKKTVTGEFTIAYRWEWLLLVGRVQGMYSTQFYGNYLFHSVPYYSTQHNSIKTDEYNMLGIPRSSGCVRLSVADVKWIYDHCPWDTPVRVLDTVTCPVVKPVSIQIEETDLDAGWDPTDPDSRNPTKSIIGYRKMAGEPADPSSFSVLQMS